MSTLLTLTFCLLLSLIITNAHPTCNERILLGKPQTIISMNGVVTKEVPGKNQSIPLFDSNKVFIFTISAESNDEITYNLEEEYLINAIGIRQRFDGKVYTNICSASLSEDLYARYNITYTNSISTETHPLEYPIGTDMGIIVPSTLLPYQKILSDSIDKKTLKIALKPEKMTTITISKEAVSIDASIFNTGVYCLQFELYGCKASQNVEENQILEYEMPQPSSNPFLDTSNQSDSLYTGLCSENYCTGGVGKLVDKHVVVGKNTPDLFVMWHLNGTGNNRNIQVGNKSISIVKILINFDDVYFFNTILIYGARKINDMDFKAPKFMAVNGILIDTSTVIDIGDTYKVLLFPWITSNIILLEFYIEVQDVAPWIALSEISFGTDINSPKCVIEGNSFRESLISLSVIASLLLITLCISIGLNIFLSIKKLHEHNKNVKNTSPIRQISQINEYRSGRIIMEEQVPNTTYESIADYQFREPIVNPEPRPSVTRLDATVSIIDMPSNPTYISTLPITIEEEVPGYSHLKYSKPTLSEIEENEQVFEGSNTLPRMRERNDMNTAKQRRASYGDQHLLSDLK